MASKTPKEKSAQPASEAHESMSPQNIWLAGLGALAQAQVDAQAEGRKAFETLVRQGLEMQNQTQKLARKQWAEAAERLEAIAGGGAQPWNRLEGIFENRVERALAHLGMPTAGQIEELTERIAQLEQAVSQLQELALGKTASAAKKTTRRKSGSKGSN